MKFRHLKKRIKNRRTAKQRAERLWNKYAGKAWRELRWEDSGWAIAGYWGAIMSFSGGGVYYRDGEVHGIDPKWSEKKQFHVRRLTILRARMAKLGLDPMEFSHPICRMASDSNSSSVGLALIALVFAIWCGFFVMQVISL